MSSAKIDIFYVQGGALALIKNYEDEDEDEDKGQLQVEKADSLIQVCQ